MLCLQERDIGLKNYLRETSSGLGIFVKPLNKQALFIRKSMTSRREVLSSGIVTMKTHTS